jgi:diguanylate cyclase (GGDEF)-like protein
MGELREDPHRALILGGGDGGSAVFDMLRDEELVEVVGVADRNPDAPAMIRARELGIATYTDIEEAVRKSAPCVAFNLTGNEMVENVAADILGAGGVIGGLEARLILRIVNRLKEAKARLRHEATHDPLTGVYNRRHIQQLLRDGLAQARRYGFPYSVALIDLDHFKRVNDTHGHPAGDAVLRHATRVLRANMRETDCLGRWGGEEFLALLPHVEETRAARAANKWLSAIRSAPADLPDGARLPVSFSAGVAGFDPEQAGATVDADMEALLHRADERLYAAKHAGRGRVKGED